MSMTKLAIDKLLGCNLENIIGPAARQNLKQHVEYSVKYYGLIPP